MRHLDIGTLFTAFIAAFVILFSVSALAQTPHNIRLTFDNDLLVPGSRDQDYTGGMSLAYGGKDVNELPLYLGALLNNTDKVFHRSQNVENYYNVEVGLYGFTPEDTQQTLANANDRPYASLLYMASTHQRIDESQQVAWQSVITIGVLGLDIFDRLQSEVHHATNSEQAQSWHHQVSDGGEFTARYQLAKQSPLIKPSRCLQVNVGRHVSIGYLTEASVSVSARFGRIDSQWWSFRPEMASYGEQRSGALLNRNERYFFAGAAFKARAYNAFLQGQFRNSDTQYSSNDINHALLEVWAGFSQSFKNGYQFSYVLRGHSSELKHGNADRNVLWGGFVLSKNLG